MWAITAAASGSRAEQHLPARHQQLVAKRQRLREIRLASAFAHRRDATTRLGVRTVVVIPEPVPTLNVLTAAVGPGVAAAVMPGWPATGTARATPLPSRLTDQAGGDWAALAQPTASASTPRRRGVARTGAPLTRPRDHAGHTAARNHGSASRPPPASRGSTARLLGLPVAGSDRFTLGTSQMRWRLLNAVPVMAAEGEDHSQRLRPARRHVGMAGRDVQVKLRYALLGWTVST